MTRQFDCNLCNKVFSSAWEMADHFRSDEHREKANGGNLDSLIEKFTAHVKKAIDSNQNEE